MSEQIISARNLTKTYRLYAKPHYRFLDVLGLLRGTGRYTEHHALHGINLDIQRGEKVALIGRNGAGKSTLLKLITGVTQPSSGSLDVRSQASALLQIGSTFHPEFTGRENVLSYLAHLGITGEEANEKLVGIIDFSELEEYIDQPVKTYSTGMGARLMFAASTAMQPELLVIDEILSVGDAYFAKKSFERIEELCNNGRTTLLLVSHDVYSASKLCERMVWIDSGKVMIDGPSPLVMKAYEDSIRVQEENRLRRNKLLKLEAAHRALGKSGAGTLLIEICTQDNEPLPQPVIIGQLEIEGPDSLLKAPIDEDNISIEVGAPFLDLAVGVWGDVVEKDGRGARLMLDHGSPFNKVVAGFPGVDETFFEQSELRIKVASDVPTRLYVRSYFANRSTNVGVIDVAGGGDWTSASLSLTPITKIDEQAQAAFNEVRTTGVHGTGVIRVLSVRVFNSMREESSAIGHGEPFSIELDLDIRDPEFQGSPQILMAFLKDGVFDVCRVIERGISLNAGTSRSALVRVEFERCQLGSGTYALSIMIAEHGYYDKTQTVFFSINPGVYACLSRAVEFNVTGGGVVGSGTGYVAEACWTIPMSTELSTLSNTCFDIAASEDKVLIDFPCDLVSKFPLGGTAGLAAADAIWKEIRNSPLDALSRHSPGLKGFDWQGYLQLSAIRVAYAHQALRRAGVENGKLLDCGSYFGNFSLAFKSLGYEVDALDSYEKYGLSLQPVVEMMKCEGIRVLDFKEVGFVLDQIPSNHYDAVLLMGVIEHIPHSPKALMQAVDRILRPTGVLILDTPNFAYEYKRELVRFGKSPNCPIEYQYETEIPFDGHHREYVTDEILWMIERINHEIVSVDHFNYSCFALKELAGVDAEHFRSMQKDPLRREIILTASRTTKHLTSDAVCK